MASRGGGKNAVHRTWLTLGERLRGELQREAERRAVGPGDLLHAEGGADTYGAIPTYLQPGQAPQLSRLQAAGTPGRVDCRAHPRACGTNIATGTKIGGRSMDYHLDWIHAGLFLSSSANQLNKVHENKVPIVTANQEDIDLLVAFEELGVTHLLMIEAKAATGWTNKQTLSKANRLREMFGEGDGRKKYPDVKPSFCLTSPRPPQLLDSDLWPSWMAPGGKPIWLELEVPPGRRRITRCDPAGRSSARGEFFRVI